LNDTAEPDLLDRGVIVIGRAARWIIAVDDRPGSLLLAAVKFLQFRS